MALKEASSVHRPFWSEDLIEWLIQSVILSLDSAAGEFGGEWYRAKCGVPTGGKLCVYLANIAVFYVLKFSFVHVNQFCSNVLFFFRFIDDCTGCWRGSLVHFYKWFVKLYNFMSANFGLRVTFVIKPANDFIDFLDVSYRFIDNVLYTDVFYKPTDAHRYFNFHSFHAPHVFRGEVG